MAAAALSTTEAALENQRLGGLQLRVAALCTLVQICDGYDVVMLSFGDVRPHSEKIKRAGALLICQVQTLEQVREAVSIGADVLSRKARKGVDMGFHVVHFRSYPPS